MQLRSLLISATRTPIRRAISLSTLGWTSYFTYSFFVCLAHNAFGTSAPACLHSLTPWFASQYGLWLVLTPILFVALSYLARREQKRESSNLEALRSFTLLGAVLVFAVVLAILWRVVWESITQVDANLSAVAVESFRAQVSITAFACLSWYVVLKPRKTKAEVQHPVSRHLRVQKGAGEYMLDVERIVYVVADGNYMELHCGNAQYLLRATMTELEAMLPSDQFMRVHRSHLLNFSKLEEFRSDGSGGGTALMSDGSKVKVSRRYRQMLFSEKAALSAA